MPGIYDDVTGWAQGRDLYGSVGPQQGKAVERVQTGWDWSALGQGIEYFNLDALNAPNPYYQPTIRYDESIQPGTPWPVDLSDNIYGG